MQNYRRIIHAMAAVFALAANTTKAEVQYELHTAYATEYIWRGAELGDHLLELGLDVSNKINDQICLTGGVWSGFFDAPQAASGEINNETDWYARASYETSWAKFSLGYIYYWNVGSLGVDNQEICASISHDFGCVEASFTYFWDIIENQGGNNGYSELTLCHGWDLNPCISLHLFSTLGMLAENGLQPVHWTSKAAFDWGFSENAKLSPFVTFSLALDERARTMWSETSNELVVGCQLSTSF